jgi:rare lipoprotein A
VRQSTRRRIAFLAGLAGLTACAPGGFFDRLFHGPPPPPSAPVAYVVGGGYRAGGVWYYPRESLNYDATGIANITPSGHPRLTTDNEPFDPDVLAGAHQTLQLPSIARVTNLENGRQILLRLNDRGPAAPSRILQVTPRAAALLGFGPAGIARVRVEIEALPSQALMEQLHGGAAAIAVAPAPIGAVQADSLAPPPGVQVSPRAGAAGAGRAEAVSTDVANAPPPLRLPETVLQLPPAPGTLWIDAGHFGRMEYASSRAAQLSGTGARVERTLIGNTNSFSVRIGPLSSVAQADATLDQVVRAGVTDASIVVEQD